MGSADEQRPPKGKRRWVRFSAAVLLTLAAVSAALWLALQTPWLRGQVAQQVAALLNQLLRGRFSVGAIEKLSLTHVVVRDFEVRDRSGQRVVWVGRAEGTLELAPLLHGDLVLAYARADAAWVSLHAQGTSLAIAEVFLPRASSAEPAAPTSDPFLFRIRKVDLRAGTAVAIPGGFEARSVSASGELSYSDAYRMSLSYVRADARDVRSLRAALRGRSFRLRLGPAEWSDLTAELGLGRDRVVVELGARWSEDGFRHARATLRAALTPEGLGAGGLQRLASALRASVVLDANANWEKPDQRLSLAARMTSAGGELLLRAQRSERSGHAEVRSAGLDLAQVLTYPGMPRVQLDLSMDTELRDAQRQFVLRARGLRYNADAIPDWLARGSFDQAGAHVTSLELPSWDAQQGRLQVDLQGDYLGNLRASLEASLPRLTSRSRLGQLSGLRSEALQLRARARYDVSADKLLADASLRIADLRRQEGSVAQLNARLDVRGRLGRPQLAAEVAARRVTLGGLRIDALNASAKGGPTQYTLSANATARGARADAELGLLLGRLEQRVSGSATLRGWLKQPLQLTLDEVRIRPDEIRVANVRATAGSSVLAIEGSYGRTRASDLHVRLEGLAFHAPWRAARADEPPKQGLRGHLAAHLHVTGSATKPDAELSLGCADLTFAEQSLGDLRLLASLKSGLQRAQAQLWLTRAEGDALHVAIGADLPSKGSLSARFDRAEYALEARAKQDVARLLRLLLPEREQTSHGALELAAQLRGPWRRPLGALELTGSQITLEGEQPFDARIVAEVAEGESRLAAQLTDAKGPVADVHADVKAALWSVLQALQHDRLRQLSARYTAHLAERRLAELPRVLRADLPVSIKLDAELTTAPDVAPHALVNAEARYLPQEEDARCAAFAAPRLQLSARIDEDLLVAELHGDSAGHRLLEASLVGPTPGWSQLTSGRLEHGFKFALDANDLELGSLPGLCAEWSGRLAGGMRGEALLTERPKLAGQLHLRRLRYAGANPSDVSLGARLDRHGLKVVGVDVRQADRHVLQAEASLPWRWDGGAGLALHADQCRVQATLSQLAVADLAGAIPAIAQPSGHVSGQVSLVGCQDLSGLRGSLALDHAGFTLKDPMLRAEGLSAQLRLAPQAIELSSLTLSDQGGMLKGSGRVQIDQGRLSRGQFTFRATAFPLRSDARVSGYLDGAVDVALNWSSIPHRIAVSLDKIAVRLPQRSPRASQSLERHADVTYLDMAAPVKQPLVIEPGVPVELKLLSEQPFWVRSNELSAQLKLDLTILSGAQDVELRGKVDVVRGFLNLFSKGFDIERGTLVFDGSQRIDPTVSLDAVHKLGDGQTVTVHVRDRLSAPAVTFSTSVAGITSDAEILQMLVRGREASAVQTAQGQVGAALAGMTSELLGSLANTRIGKYVPVLSLEAGASSGTRLRAGVEANSLIPKKLRNVVEGAYVEGFVGSRNQGGNATTAGGVLMELYYPKDLVTSGAWELPNNWTIELTWEP